MILGSWKRAQPQWSKDSGHVSGLQPSTDSGRSSDISVPPGYTKDFISAVDSHHILTTGLWMNSSGFAEAVALQVVQNGVMARHQWVW